MNTTERFSVVHPANLMLAVVTGLIGAAGLPGNMFLAGLIVSQYKKRQPHEWLLFILAITDFCLCLNNAALEAFFITDFNRLECKIAGAIDYYFGAISFIVPTLVAYNRYVSLYNQQKYTKLFTNRFILFLCLPIFGMSAVWITPFVVYNALGQDDMGLCGIQITNAFLAVDMISINVGMMTSYGFMGFFCYKVVAKIRNHRRQHQQSSIGESRLIRESGELITVMIAVAVVPLFVQLPAGMLNFFQTFSIIENRWISRAIMAPFPTTSAINAFITMYVIKDYRQTLKTFFRRVFCRGTSTTEMPINPTSSGSNNHPVISKSSIQPIIIKEADGTDNAN